MANIAEQPAYRDIIASSEQLAQRLWRDLGSFATGRVIDYPKRKYILDMFPFPSGSGLHMGHVKGYTATDVLAHYYRRSGYDVLHPMGWDAFGLPAEVAATQEGIMPQTYIGQNVATFKQQLEKLGLIYDWEGREINTSDPVYYKWTQSTFLDMLNSGLARYEERPINWCPHCATSLANEDLEGEAHERCGTPVERQLRPQWVIDMQSSADRLLDNLGELPEWEQEIVDAQVNWIGRSEGYSLDCSLVVGGKEITTACFLPLTQIASNQHIDNAQYTVQISPEKALELLGESIEDEKIRSFLVKNAHVSPQNRSFDSITTDYVIAINGVTFPIDISTAINDRKFGMQLSHREGILVEEVGQKLFLETLLQQRIASAASTYRIDDWIFSRQRYWGEPIPVVRDTQGNIIPLAHDQLPLVLPEIQQIPKGQNGKSPLDQVRSWVEVRGYVDGEGKFHQDPNAHEVYYRETDTMPNWAGSSAYFIRYLDPHNPNELVNYGIAEEFPQVDVYVGGMEHAARHLIYARFWNQFLYDQGQVPSEEPFKQVRHVGLVLGPDGKKMSKSKGNGVNPLDMVARYGGDATRLGMFEMGEFAKTTVWDESKIQSAVKFLDKVWKMQQVVGDQDPDLELTNDINRTIDIVEYAIPEFRFGAAISAIKHLANVMNKLDVIPGKAYSTMISLLQPFAPHIAEIVSSTVAGNGVGHVAALLPWPEKIEVDHNDKNTNKSVAMPLRSGSTIVGEILADPSDAESVGNEVNALGMVVLKIVNGKSPMVIVQ